MSERLACMGVRVRMFRMLFAQPIRASRFFATAAYLFVGNNFELAMKNAIAAHPACSGPNVANGAAAANITGMRGESADYGRQSMLCGTHQNIVYEFLELIARHSEAILA